MHLLMKNILSQVYNIFNFYKNIFITGCILLDIKQKKGYNKL